MIRCLLVALALLFALPAQAEVRRFTDAELIDGFMKTVFGSEYGTGGVGADRVKKYTRGVRIFVDAWESPDLPRGLGRVRKVEAERLLRQIASRVRGVTIQIVPTMRQANLLVFVTDQRRYLSVGGYSSNLSRAQGTWCCR